MQVMDSSSWQRMGSSVVWSPELLAPLIRTIEPTPIRTAIGWVPRGFPENPPGDSQTILVGGLQTVLETIMTTASAEEAYAWLRANVLPLVRAIRSQWDRVGLVFGMDGPGTLFNLHESDDLVYFGRSKEREQQVSLTLGLWNGASTGQGAFQLIVPGSREVGGYHVKRVS
jgi:hypothetical protein